MIDGKLLIFGRPLSVGAASWLRTTQHLNAIARSGRALCPVTDPLEDDPEIVWKTMCLADVVVSNAARVDEFMLETVRLWTSRGKPWVWDVDDDPVNISPYNPAYAVFGLHEVRFAEPVNGEEWLWKNGMEVQGRVFDTTENRRRNEQYLALLREHVSAVTTTTEYLAAKLATLAPKTPIFVRPNVLDFREVWTTKRRRSKDGKIRVLYQGGSSHYADLDTVLEALATIAKVYPHVVFLFMGDTKAHAGKALPADRIEEYEWTGDYHTFAMRQALLGPDIAIAPLCMDEQVAEFNRCKSPLKWLDAAALGIPCVCQRETPYQEVVNFGAAPETELNGLLARTTQDWVDCLSVLIENPDMRDLVGANAHAIAVSDYNVDNWVGTYMRQYEEILDDGHKRNGHPRVLANSAR